MDVTTTQNDSSNSDSQPNRRRRKKSVVWDYFTPETLETGCTKAVCNLCKRPFAYKTGPKQSGTSHLKRHITRGICPVLRSNGQSSPDTLPSTSSGSVDGLNLPGPDTPPLTSNLPVKQPRKRVCKSEPVASIYLDGVDCGHVCAMMIIQHDHPLDIVEQPEFICLANSLSPNFGLTNVGSVEEHIMNVYFNEKGKLLELVRRIPGRLNLTMDVWTSNRNMTYLLLTGHFTDHDWKAQRRVFNFVEIPFPESDTAFSNGIMNCLTDWSSEGKLFTFTLNGSNVNENGRGNIRSLLSIKSNLILNGQLLINSCYACVLTSLAQQALSSMKETVDKVRHSVKYVKTSEVNEERFRKLKEKLQVPSSSNLTIDDVMKWNSTYHMLVAASELKEVFSCLDTIDPEYKSTLSMGEWERVGILCMYLKMFYEAATVLTLPVYPTSNVFFDDVWKIQSELMQAASSSDDFVRSLTSPLLNMFSKYWAGCNLVLAIAVVMDPRFKMQLVQFGFSRIHGMETDSWLKIVDEGLHELFAEYVVQSLPGPTFAEEGNALLSDGFLEIDIYFPDFLALQLKKEELNQYLGEPVMPRIQDFDVLGWWKEEGSRYPTLCKMAIDVLSIPVSTLPPESVFDVRERKVDSSRSSLRGKTLEALVCAKDWLR